MLHIFAPFFLVSTMIKRDGIFSIYKGVDAAIGRQMVYGTARIGLHRKISDKLVEVNGGNSISFAAKTLSGMASGSLAVCIGTPFDMYVTSMHGMYSLSTMSKVHSHKANTLL